MPELDREVRLRVAVDLSVHALLTGAGYTVRSGPPTQQRTQLFDTGDRRLTAAGAELSFARRAGWTWRRDGLGHPKLAPRTWSAPAETAAAQVALWTRAYRRGRPLAERATVTVHHRVHSVSAGDAVVDVGEEWVDVAVSGSPDGHPRARRVTVRAADPPGFAVLQALARAALPDEPTLGLLRPASVRSPRLSLPPPASLAPRDLFARSTTLAVVQWLYFDCELSGGGAPEALRKVRVAVRRLRSDLQTFAPLLDREWADGLRARLGVLGRELGRVRDAEVLAGRLEGLAAALPMDEQVSAAPLLDIARSQLASGRASLSAVLGAPDYTTLLGEALDAAVRPRWADPQSASLSLTSLARRPWRRLRSHAAAVTEVAGADELHRLRVLAKRARYAADACAPAIGEPAARSAATLAALQAILGEHHDASVTRAWLHEQALASTALGFPAGELAALELAPLDSASRRWQEAWSDASRRRDWRWLRS